MEKLSLLNKIEELYSQGINIIKYLKQLEGSENNSVEDVMISYDFQAGTYIKGYNEKKEFVNNYCRGILKVIEELDDYNTIMEVGVGEATTLGVLLSMINDSNKISYGFDISWSRIKYANKFLKQMNLKDVKLFTADLFNIPIKDNSIDIIYTSHSIEPNGGKERESLEELYRITNKYLILLEPAYEFANEDGKKRMIEHGYITNLYGMAVKLGYNVIIHRPFEESVNPLNPTGLIVIKKDPSVNENNKELLCCPITKGGLIKRSSCYYSKQGLVAYPIIEDIPCLLKENAIVATKLLD